MAQNKDDPKVKARKGKGEPRAIALRYLIILPTAVFITLSIAAGAAMGSRSWNRSSEDFSDRLIRATNENLSLRLDVFLKEAYNACIASADAIGRLGLYRPDRSFELQSHLREMAAGIFSDLPQIGAFAVGTEDGDYVGYRREPSGVPTLMVKDGSTRGKLLVYRGAERSSPIAASSEKYDPRLSPWYAPSVGQGRPAWSPVHNGLDERGAVTITATAPIMDKGLFRGVAALDVKLDAFNDFLAKEALRYGGTIYLVDADGLLLASSSSAPVLADGKGELPLGARLPAAMSGDPVIASSALSVLPAGAKPGIGKPIAAKDHRLLPSAQPFSSKGGIEWTIVSALGEEEILGTARRDSRRSLALAVGCSLLAFAICLLILGTVARLSRQVVEAADAIAAGSRGIRLPEDIRIAEPRRLAHAFNSMADALVGATEELESTVARRTAELRASNDRLEQTLADLRRTQSQMILTEKMASLGQLVAGIAHDLNTPFAAVASSNRLISRTLTIDLLGIATAWEKLGPEARVLIAEARNRQTGGSFRMPSLDPAAERRARRELRDRLLAVGLEDPVPIADDLVALGLDEPGFISRLIPQIAGPAREAFLTVLYGVVQMAQASRVVEEAVSKASRVITALKSYVRRDTLEKPTRVDLAEEISALATLYHDRLKRGISLSTDFSGGSLVMGRRDELNQVWMNLLDNAVQAVGEKGRIEISTKAAGGMLEVTVVDDGHGIPDEVKSRIFEPFFSTRPPGEGLGMGLDLSRRVVEGNGGTIDFESRPGRTEFRVRLPRLEAESPS